MHKVSILNALLRPYKTSVITKHATIQRLKPNINRRNLICRKVSSDVWILVPNFLFHNSYIAFR